MPTITPDLSQLPISILQIQQSRRQAVQAQQQAELGQIQIGAARQQLVDKQLLNQTGIESGGDYEKQIELLQKSGRQDLAREVSMQYIDFMSKQYEKTKLLATTEQQVDTAKTQTNKRLAANGAVLTDPTTGGTVFSPQAYISGLESRGEGEAALEYKKKLQDLRESMGKLSSAELKDAKDIMELNSQIYNSIFLSKNQPQAWENAKQAHPELIRGDFPGAVELERVTMELNSAKDAATLHQRKYDVIEDQQKAMNNWGITQLEEKLKQAITQQDHVLVGQIENTKPKYAAVLKEASSAKKAKENLTAVKDILSNIDTNSLTSWKTAIQRYAMAASPDSFDKYIGDINNINSVSSAEALLGQLVISTIGDFGGNPTEGEREYAKGVNASILQTPETRNTLIAILERNANRKIYEEQAMTELISRKAHMFGEGSDNLIAKMQEWDDRNKPSYMDSLKPSKVTSSIPGRKLGEEYMEGGVRYKIDEKTGLRKAWRPK